MKKIFAILVTLLMAVSSLFSLTACNDEGGGEVIELNGKTAEVIYNETVAAIETYKTNFTFDCNYDVAVNVSMGENSFPMNMKLYTTLATADGDFYEKMYLDMGEMLITGGESEDLGKITMETTFVDEVAYLYTEMTGLLEEEPTKIKVNKSFAEILAQLGKDEDTMYNPIYDFSNTSFDGIKFIKVENEYCFELVLSGAQAQDFTNETLQSMNQVGTNTQYSDISYKFFVSSEGKFDHAEISFTTSMNIATFKYEYAFSGKIEFKNIGTTVVTAPIDAEDYTSMNFPSLT